MWKVLRPHLSLESEWKFKSLAVFKLDICATVEGVLMLRFLLAASALTSQGRFPCTLSRRVSHINARILPSLGGEMEKWTYITRARNAYYPSLTPFRRPPSRPRSCSRPPRRWIPKMETHWVCKKEIWWADNIHGGTSSSKMPSKASSIVRSNPSKSL